MRVLVTGGAGFLGSHLCERLLKEKHEVICLDNFFTGRRRNLHPYLANPDFELVRHDVVEPLMLEVDRIYHLACPASPIHYQYNPVKTIKTSVLGTHNMLGLAKRTRGRFLLASTSEVYGDPKVHPQTEDYWGNVNPIGIRSCYDEGKRVAETGENRAKSSQNASMSSWCGQTTTSGPAAVRTNVMRSARLRLPGRWHEWIASAFDSQSASPDELAADIVEAVRKGRSLILWPGHLLPLWWLKRSSTRLYTSLLRSVTTLATRRL